MAKEPILLMIQFALSQITKWAPTFYYAMQYIYKYYKLKKSEFE